MSIFNYFSKAAQKKRLLKKIKELQAAKVAKAELIREKYRYGLHEDAEERMLYELEMSNYSFDIRKDILLNKVKAL